MELSPVTREKDDNWDHLEWANPAAGLGSLSWSCPTLLHRSPSAPPWMKLLPDLRIPDRDLGSLHHLQPGEGPALSVSAGLTQFVALQPLEGQAWFEEQCQEPFPGTKVEFQSPPLYPISVAGSAELLGHMCTPGLARRTGVSQGWLPPGCPDNCLGFRARETPIFGSCQLCWLWLWAGHPLWPWLCESSAAQDGWTVLI